MYQQDVEELCRKAGVPEKVYTATDTKKITWWVGPIPDLVELVERITYGRCIEALLALEDTPRSPREIAPELRKRLRAGHIPAGTRRNKEWEVPWTIIKEWEAEHGRRNRAWQLEKRRERKKRRAAKAERERIAQLEREQSAAQIWPRPLDGQSGVDSAGGATGAGDRGSGGNGGGLPTFRVPASTRESLVPDWVPGGLGTGGTNTTGESK